MVCKSRSDLQEAVKDELGKRCALGLSSPAAPVAAPEVVCVAPGLRARPRPALGRDPAARGTNIPLVSGGGATG